MYANVFVFCFVCLVSFCPGFAFVFCIFLRFFLFFFLFSLFVVLLLLMFCQLVLSLEVYFILKRSLLICFHTFYYYACIPKFDLCIYVSSC